MWHNFDERETNLSASGNALAQLHILVPDIAWTQSTIIASDDGFVWRYVITGSAPGGQLRLPGCIVAQIRDDRITRVEEYLDTKQAKVLRP